MLALRDLIGSRWPATLLGVLAVSLGSALVAGVVLIVGAFAGQLDTTLLGTYLSARVRPFHVLLGALTMVVAVLSASEIVTLGYLEREEDFAALRALGWPRRAVGGFLAVQALAIGVLGGVVGASVAGLLGAAVGAAGSSLWPSVVAVGVAAASTVAAAAGPIVAAYRASPAEALRGE